MLAQAVAGLGAREKQSFLRCEVRCPLEARRACEAQVGAERVAHRVDEALGAARREAVLPPEAEHLHRPPARSMRGSIRPTRRSPKSIGSTYQPQRRLAGGTKSSQTYSNSNRDPRRPRSHTNGSNGGRNATEGGGSGGRSSSSTSVR